MQRLLLEVWTALPRTVLFVTHDVEEALLLSDTIYVMTAGPGCVLEEVEVDLPRPRPEGLAATAGFTEMRRRLLDILGVRGQWPDRRGAYKELSAAAGLSKPGPFRTRSGCKSFRSDSSSNRPQAETRPSFISTRWSARQEISSSRWLT